MARVLARGTGAEAAEVWLMVGDQPSLAATWPPGAAVEPGANPLSTAEPGRRTHLVRHDGQMLGVLVVRERDQVPLTSVEERLFGDLADQSGLMLKGARLRGELERRAAEQSARADELRLSRQRLVDAQDNERRALERDVHDGAQQHLVALAVNLRLAHTLSSGSPERAAQLLAGQEAAAGDAVETVLQLTRGIYPPLLAEGGLEVALRAALGNSPVPVELVAESVGRYPPSLEAAAYFCCLEALQNAAKYSGASRIWVELRGAPDGSLDVRRRGRRQRLRPRYDPPRKRADQHAGPPRCRRRGTGDDVVPDCRHPDRRPDPRGGGVMSARIAWVLASVTFVFVVIDIAVTAAYSSLFSEAAVAVHGFPFTQLAVLGSGLLGAVILTRYERHAVGVLLCLVGVVASFSLVTEAYHIWVIDEGGPGPKDLAAVAGWASSLTGGQAAFAGLALMFLVAPDGHFLSRRWRWAAWVIVSGLIICSLVLLTVDPTTFSLQDSDVGGVRGPAFSIGFFMIGGGLIASLVSMLIRLHRSRGEERQQVRLIALAVAALVVGLANLLIIQSTNGGEQTWVASLPLLVAYVLMPVLFALAALRYRLYDIEVVINRTVVLAVGFAFAGIGYTTVVVAVGRMVDVKAAGLVLSLLATAIVAIAFQPLRRGVIRLANRIAYGAQGSALRSTLGLQPAAGRHPEAGGAAAGDRRGGRPRGGGRPGGGLDERPRWGPALVRRLAWDSVRPRHDEPRRPRAER